MKNHVGSHILSILLAFGLGCANTAEAQTSPSSTASPAEPTPSEPGASRSRAEKELENLESTGDTLRELIKVVPRDGLERVELIFRLAEVHRNMGQVRSELGLSGEEKYNRQALKLYVYIIKKYPDYERMDETLFMCGTLLLESGKQNAGTKLLTTLVKNHPNSPFEEAAQNILRALPPEVIAPPSQ